MQAVAGGPFTVFNPAGVDSAGVLSLHGRNITYSGIDRQELTNGDPLDLVIFGTVFDDRIVLENAPAAGEMRVRFEGVDFFDGFFFSSGLVFTNPADSLSIYGLDGRDHIEVASLDPLFSADLKIYGSRLPIVAALAPVPEEDPYNDTVVFSGDIDLQGGFLDVWAETIRVEAGVTIAVGDNDIVFRARSTGIPELENLLPLYATFREVNIDIGAGATLSADGAIYLIAEADDKSIADLAGVPVLVDKFVIGPLIDQIQSLFALPVKVLTKNSTSIVTLHDGASLLAGGTVGVYATAGADASGSASGSLFSLGYANANALARVDIGANVQVVSTDEAVVVTADGSATANISTSTDRGLKSTPNPGSAQIALSLAVSYAEVRSHVTVAQGALIDAGKTANVTAAGSVDSQSSAKSGIFSDGAAGLAFALQFSDADITTAVDGTVIARAKDGYTVKIEIDPTVGPGEVGYVDYANDRIFVGPNALVSEDTISYSNRRGTSIGGLVDGREYYVIALDGGLDQAGRECRAGVAGELRRGVSPG